MSEINRHVLRAVIIDVDGTTTEVGSNDLAPSVHRFFTRQPRSPDIVTVATGRIYGNLARMGLAALCSGLLITESGARIVDPSGSTVSAHLVGEHALQDFARRVQGEEIRLQYACYARGGMFPYTFFVAEREDVPKRYAAGAVVFQNIWEFVEEAAREACKVNFRIQRDSIRPEADHIAWNNGSADLLGPNVSKAAALQEVGELLGIRIEQMLFAGDDWNDLKALGLQGLMKLFVGDKLDNKTLQRLGVHARVSTPEELGLALMDLFPST